MSAQPHCSSVSEYSSSLRDGELKPRRATPSTIVPVVSGRPVSGRCDGSNCGAVIVASGPRDLGLLGDLDLRLVLGVVVARDLHAAVAAHVLQRLHALGGGLLGQPRHGVLEHPAVVLLQADLLAGAVGRLVVLADAQRAVRIGAPGDLDPELALLPDLARVGLVGELDLPGPSARARRAAPAGGSPASARSASRRSACRGARDRGPSAARSPTTTPSPTTSASARRAGRRATRRAARASTSSRRDRSRSG